MDLKTYFLLLFFRRRFHEMQPFHRAGWGHWPTTEVRFIDIKESSIGGLMCKSLALLAETIPRTRRKGETFIAKVHKKSLRFGLMMGDLVLRRIRK